MNVSSSAVDDAWLWNAVVLEVVVDGGDGLEALLALWVLLLFGQVVVSVRDVSAELAVRLVGLVKVMHLLPVCLLAEAGLLLVLALLHTLRHIDSGSTQKACGFVHNRLILGICLRYLGGIELLTDLASMSALVLHSPSRVLIATARGPHLDVFFIVVVLN